MVRDTGGMTPRLGLEELMFPLRVAVLAQIGNKCDRHCRCLLYIGSRAATAPANGEVLASHRKLRSDSAQSPTPCTHLALADEADE